MAAEQLERSVLERKERDELRAIAQAMAIEATSRMRKADLITKILVAAGVEAPSPDAEGVTSAPRSGRGRGRKAAEDAAPSESLFAEATEGSDARVVEPEAARAGSGTPGLGERPRDSEATPDGNDPVQAATEASGQANNGQGGVPPVANGSAIGAGSSGPDSVGTRGNGAGPVAAGEEGRGGPTAAPSPGSAAGTDAGPGGSSSNGQSLSPAGLPTVVPNGGQSANGEGGGPSGPRFEPGGSRRGRRRRGRGQDRGEPHGNEQHYQGELVPVRGLLDLREEGYGFLRAEGYLPSQRDVYVSMSQARRFALRKGDWVEGACRPAGNSEKFPALVRIDSVSGMSPEEARSRPRFEDLTPLFPDTRLRLETPGSPDNLTARIIDLLAPIGKGQRGLIVSPPKAGKTTIMKQIAHSIEANNPEVHLMVLLVDERPEEVTDMRRSVKGEVIASTFDRPSDEHTQVAELVIERAKRLVELGKDVVIILDGITRLARAYNLAQPASGRIMSGGVDSGALYPPKKFFGAARNIEEGGSLTILATALVETGSKMDEVIFEEFKGTGNMELRLDRRLAERRLYPAIDVNASSTRHEELLFERGQLQQVWKLRRVLNALAAEGNAAAGLDLLLDKIKTTRSNDEFLAEIAKGPAPVA
ncbi:transcription termination factor Rho [Aciditerrimonas ferrireducens]|uniref:transcription termination factor Rho n=1 Tax=Aciditerrimonas ferrireducens TaxID=667306 RepID=UPI002004EB97|nr:transcription termination factor Rho [Aciditerrimonas ferrireducens]MCK4176318.1 transcription termination factor Rho [Aciditerrimonas ferrireducens]